MKVKLKDLNEFQLNLESTIQGFTIHEVVTYKYATTTPQVYKYLYSCFLHHQKEYTSASSKVENIVYSLEVTILHKNIFYFI